MSFTPCRLRIFSVYARGSGKVSEILLRTISRSDDEPSTPEYQAAMKVRRNKNAMMTIATPSAVRMVRSRLRNADFQIKPRNFMLVALAALFAGERALVEAADDRRGLGGV